MRAEDLEEAERLWQKAHAGFFKLEDLFDRTADDRDLFIWVYARMGELLADHRKLQQALITERAQVIAISEYYHHNWHDRFYTDEENLEGDARKELQAEGFDLPEDL